LRDTIESLLAQTLPPDTIYLNLPRGRNRRTNQTYEVLPYLEEYVARTQFRILRCEDVGPLTKLVPTLLAEPDPQTFVVTVDSDKIYHPSTVAALVWRAHHDPTAAFGLCGWSFYWQPPPMSVVPVYVPWLTRGKLGRAVDVLQACCGNVYRRAFFPDIELLRHPHPKCFTTDDLWIAAYLALRTHVKRVIINTPGQTRITHTATHAGRGGRGRLAREDARHVRLRISLTVFVPLCALLLSPFLSPPSPPCPPPVLLCFVRRVRWSLGFVRAADAFLEGGRPREVAVVVV